WGRRCRWVPPPSAWCRVWRRRCCCRWRCSSPVSSPWRSSVLITCGPAKVGVMRIATLTSGGDCPGLNAVIRGIVRTASSEFGSTVVGYEDGWQGLLEDRRVDLYDDEHIDRILLRGGTILGTGRLHPDKFKAGLDQIKANLEE